MENYDPLKNYFLVMKILATLALIVQHYYVVPLSAGSGIVDGLIMYAVWRAK